METVILLTLARISVLWSFVIDNSPKTPTMTNTKNSLFVGGNGTQNGSSSEKREKANNINYHESHASGSRDP